MLLINSHGYIDVAFRGSLIVATLEPTLTGYSQALDY